MISTQKARAAMPKATAVPAARAEAPARVAVVTDAGMAAVQAAVHSAIAHA